MHALIKPGFLLLEAHRKRSLQGAGELPLGLKGARVRESQVVEFPEDGPSFMGSVQEFSFSQEFYDGPQIYKALHSIDALRALSHWSDEAAQIRGLTYVPVANSRYTVELNEFFHAAPMPSFLARRLRRKFPLSTLVEPIEIDRSLAPWPFTSELWGYEFLRHREVPNWMAAGPGLFDSSIQSFALATDSSTTRLLLLFVATPVPSAFLRWGRFDPFEWLIRGLSVVRASTFAEFLRRRLALEMVEIHNTVHRRVVLQLAPRAALDGAKGVMT